MPTAKPDMQLIWATAGASVKPADSKIQEGWQAEKPPFQTENWSQQRQDQFLKHVDEHGIAEWSNNTEYVKGALAWRFDVIWESLIINNLGNVPADGQGFWQSQSNLDTRGDTMTGQLDLQQGLNVHENSSAARPGQIRITDGATLNRATLEALNITSQVGLDLILQLYSNLGVLGPSLKINFDGTLNWNGQNVWTAGNDGQGSGLNADLLDDKHLSEILSDIAGNFVEYTVPGTFFLTVPSSIYVMFLSVSGAGAGGSGGGDPFNAQCNDGGAAPLPLTVDVGATGQLVRVYNGADPKGIEFVKNNITTSNVIQGFATLTPFPVGNFGGDGGSGFFGLPGIGDTRLGGPFAEWHGSVGCGGAGGGTTNGGGFEGTGYGGAGGFMAIGVPFPVIPGETISITIPSGTNGTVGCLSTGGNGGNGYAALHW